MRSRLIVAAAALLLPLLWPTPALGAWGGELDGNGHPMVGAIYADFDASGTITWDELVCSGSYAGRSKDDLHEVFLTAAHCLAWAPQDGFDTLFVSFDEDPQEGDGIPEGLIGSGSFAWDERWGHDASVGFDVGVVLLPPGSVGGVTPVELPPPGYLGDLRAAGELKGMLFELVGYGMVPGCWGREPPSPCVVPAWNSSFDGLRRVSLSPAKALTTGWLWLQMNASATDLGGACYGDSGAPRFLPATTMVVATTTGGDPVCRANSNNFRLDTPAARAFLGSYLVLPG